MVYYCTIAVGFLPRLLSYETSKQRHNIPVLSVIDSLQKVFSTSYSPVVLIRSVGLQFTNALWPVKVSIQSSISIHPFVRPSVHPSVHPSIHPSSLYRTLLSITLRKQTKFSYKYIHIKQFVNGSC